MCLLFIVLLAAAATLTSSSGVSVNESNKHCSRVMCVKRCGIADADQLKFTFYASQILDSYSTGESGQPASHGATTPQTSETDHQVCAEQTADFQSELSTRVLQISRKQRYRLQKCLNQCIPRMRYIFGKGMPQNLPQ